MNIYHAMLGTALLGITTAACTNIKVDVSQCVDTCVQQGGDSQRCAAGCQKTAGGGGAGGGVTSGVGAAGAGGASPTCSDSAKNGMETDVDCGGGACPACFDGKHCDSADDCVSKVCSAGVCLPPSCADGVKNGGETAVDCGGSCPSVPETCNGKDDDCNGLTDDGLGTISCGTGACEVTIGACQAGAPPICVPLAPSIEICDGLDNDCNGQVDDNATDKELWCLDADGDGHGDPSKVVFQCSPPEGYSPLCDDCDDQDPEMSPSAPEICGDGLDNDCDGQPAPNCYLTNQCVVQCTISSTCGPYTFTCAIGTPGLPTVSPGTQWIGNCDMSGTALNDYYGKPCSCGPCGCSNLACQSSNTPSF